MAGPWSVQIEGAHAVGLVAQVLVGTLDPTTHLGTVGRPTETTPGAKKGSGTKSRNGPSGASHFWFLTPFSQ